MSIQVGDTVRARYSDAPEWKMGLIGKARGPLPGMEHQPLVVIDWPNGRETIEMLSDVDKVELRWAVVDR